MLSSSRYNLTRVRLQHLLAELKSHSVEVGSLCVPPGSSKTDVEGMMAAILDIQSAPAGLAESIAGSPTGAMLFWGASHRYLVMPPFPLAGMGVSKTCEIEPLSSLLDRELILGLVLVRMGAYGIGVFAGQKLLASKVGTGLVHSRHRQGGSSAHRFERHRDKQAETMFTRVCEHAREQMEPYARRMDYLIYGGARETILDFRRQCRFMHEFDSRSLERLLDVREPNQTGLAEGIQEAWSSRVIQW